MCACARVPVGKLKWRQGSTSGVNRHVPVMFDSIKLYHRANTMRRRLTHPHIYFVFALIMSRALSNMRNRASFDLMPFINLSMCVCIHPNIRAQDQESASVTRETATECTYTTYIIARTSSPIHHRTPNMSICTTSTLSLSLSQFVS